MIPLLERACLDISDLRGHKMATFTFIVSGSVLCHHEFQKTGDAPILESILPCCAQGCKQTAKCAVFCLFSLKGGQREAVALVSGMKYNDVTTGMTWEL